MSSRWQAVTTDTLNSASIAALIEACDTAALAEGQTGRAADIIVRIVKRVRRKVASNLQNRLDADETTVPEGLLDDTTLLVIYALKRATFQPLTEDEVREARRIETDLNRIASGIDKIDSPDTPIAAEIEGAASIETVEDGNTGSSREEMKGL